MNRIPYHIQRCESRTGEDFTGWDSAFRCDYMGAAEFEFGALARSLRRVVARTYALHKTAVSAKDGRKLYIVACDATIAGEVAALLPDIVANKLRLKEYSYLPEMLKGGYESKTVDVWWDIDNDWFLALGEKAAKRVLETIDRQRAKWAETKGETK